MNLFILDEDHLLIEYAKEVYPRDIVTAYTQFNIRSKESSDYADERFNELVARQEEGYRAFSRIRYYRGKAVYSIGDQGEVYELYRIDKEQSDISKIQIIDGRLYFRERADINCQPLIRSLKSIPIQ